MHWCKPHLQNVCNPSLPIGLSGTQSFWIPYLQLPFVGIYCCLVSF